MEKGIIEIELKGFEKYKARADVKKPWWFKCSNELFDDEDLFDLSLEEMAAWVYIMGLSSKQQNAIVRISVRKASVRISPQLLISTIDKLLILGIVTVPSPVAELSRAESAQVADEIRTSEEKRVEEIRREESRRDAPTAPAALELSPKENENGIIPELLGNSLLEQVLSQVSKPVQRSMVETYDPFWIKRSLVKAIQYHMARQDAQSVDDVKDWPKRIANWLKQERSPKYRDKPKILKPKTPATPWPDRSAKNRAIGNLSAVAAMAKVKAGSAS